MLVGTNQTFGSAYASGDYVWVSLIIVSMMAYSTIRSRLLQLIASIKTW